MEVFHLEILLIASLVAVACALPGVFLVLRKMALISDAISHSILLGVVIGFFISGNLNSPINFIMASLTGVLTVFLVETVQNTRLVKEDTAIGLVFPSIFSLGVILVAIYANDIHLDIDAILLGELAFAPLDRLYFNSSDLGPKSLWVVAAVAMVSVFLLVLFYKELMVSTFDKALAASMGFSPVLLHYGLMTLSSVTCVVSFDAVGAVLVVALMITPAASMYLVTDCLKKMLWGSALLGIFAANVGYFFAHFFDVSIAGSITTFLGFCFFVIYLFAPQKGYFSILRKEKRQRIEVMLLTFLVHLQNHEELSERHIKHLKDHINWQKVKSNAVLELAQKNNFIEFKNKDYIDLTSKGKAFTSAAIAFITQNERSAIEPLKQNFFLFRG